MSYDHSKSNLASTWKAHPGLFNISDKATGSYTENCENLFNPDESEAGLNKDEGLAPSSCPIPGAYFNTETGTTIVKITSSMFRRHDDKSISTSPEDPHQRRLLGGAGSNSSSSSIEGWKSNADACSFDRASSNFSASTDSLGCAEYCVNEEPRSRSILEVPRSLPTLDDGHFVEEEREVDFSYIDENSSDEVNICEIDDEIARSGNAFKCDYREISNKEQLGMNSEDRYFDSGRGNVGLWQNPVHSRSSHDCHSWSLSDCSDRERKCISEKNITESIDERKPFVPWPDRASTEQRSAKTMYGLGPLKLSSTSLSKSELVTSTSISVPVSSSSFFEARSHNAGVTRTSICADSQSVDSRVGFPSFLESSILQNTDKNLEIMQKFKDAELGDHPSCPDQLQVSPIIKLPVRSRGYTSSKTSESITDYNSHGKSVHKISPLIAFDKIFG